MMARKLIVEGYLGDKKLEGPLPEDVNRRMLERLSQVMSLYYTQHPDEYIAMIKAGVIKVCDTKSSDVN